MQQFNVSIKDFLEKLLSPLNPIYLAIFASLLIAFLIFLVFKYIIIPLNRSHELEKETIELRNSKVMALFAELDPNPIIRIDKLGGIIFCNDSAKKLIKTNSQNNNIYSIISGVDFSVKNLIDEDRTITLERKIDNKFYIINIIGIKYLEIAQVYFNNISRIKQYEMQIKKKNKTLKNLYNKLYDQLEEERYRIARELHDTIGQNLLLVQMYSRKLSRQFNEDEEIKTEFKTIDNTMGKTISDIKGIIYDLKPKLLDEIGLKSAVEGLCMDDQQKFNLNYNLLIDDLKEQMNYNVKITMFRIIQEAINNIIKHSEATEFNIRIFDERKSLKMVISDNGIGFVPDYSPRGLGLSNMRERIEYLNGRLKIESLPGHGTLLVFEIKKENNENG